jgi:hypothetical protein
VRVLPAAVQEHHARRFVAELQRADGAAVEALRRRNVGHACLFGVLGQQCEFVDRRQLIVGDHATTL